MSFSASLSEIQHVAHLAQTSFSTQNDVLKVKQLRLEMFSWRVPSRSC